MPTRPLILLLAPFLTACAAPEPEVVLIVPEISADLRTPVPISQRQATTVRELGILATEHLVAAQTANAKIVATDKILTCAEAKSEFGEKPEACITD